MSRPYLHVHSDGQRYHIKWWCEETGDWRMILHDFKYAFERGERRFDPATRTWSLPLYTRARVRQWADRWFSPDEREFTEDEPAGHGYGSRSYSGSHSSYGQYGETSTSAVADAYRVLHLYPSAPPELAQAAHRILIKQVHPDRGGSHDEAVRLNAAWELVRTELERRAS